MPIRVQHGPSLELSGRVAFEAGRQGRASEILGRIAQQKRDQDFRIEQEELRFQQQLQRDQADNDRRINNLLFENEYKNFNETIRPRLNDEGQTKLRELMSKRRAIDTFARRENPPENQVHAAYSQWASEFESFDWSSFYDPEGSRVGDTFLDGPDKVFQRRRTDDGANPIVGWNPDSTKEQRDAASELMISRTELGGGKQLVTNWMTGKEHVVDIEDEKGKTTDAFGLSKSEREVADLIFQRKFDVWKHRQTLLDSDGNQMFPSEQPPTFTDAVREMKETGGRIQEFNRLTELESTRDRRESLLGKMPIDIFHTQEVPPRTAFAPESLTSPRVPFHVSREQTIDPVTPRVERGSNEPSNASLPGSDQTDELVRKMDPVKRRVARIAGLDPSEIATAESVYDYIAEKYPPGIKLDEMSKSDRVLLENANRVMTSFKRAVKDAAKHTGIR